MESGMLGFGIRIPALGIRNPANDWNPGSLFRTRNPERIRIPQCGLQNPRLSWGYQGRSSRFLNARALDLLSQMLKQRDCSWTNKDLKQAIWFGFTRIKLLLSLNPLT